MRTAFISSLVLVAACGGSGHRSGDAGPPPNLSIALSCPAPTACGGDLSGTWTIVSGCEAHMGLAGPSCSPSKVSGYGSISGTLTVNTAVGCSLTVDSSATIEGLYYPASCGLTACPALVAGDPRSSLPCGTDAAGDCICDQNFHGSGSTTYDCAASGSTFVLNPVDGGYARPDENITYSYCVMGDKLQIFSASDERTFMRSGT